MQNKAAPEQNTEKPPELSPTEKRFLELDPVLEDHCNAITDLELLSLLIEDEKKASALIDKHKTFDVVCNLTYSELLKVLSPDKARLLRLCRSVPHALFGTNKGGIHEKVFTVEKVCDYFRPFFAGAKVEKLYLLLIDKSEEVVANILIAKGSLSGINFDPKMIISKCVTCNAVKAVLAHNHFTGTAPSLADVTTTAKLTWLLGHLGIELVDHIIFYKSFHHSMRHEGEMASLGYSRIFAKY